MKGYIEQVKRILVEMLDKSHFGKDRNGVPTLNSKASGAIKRHWGGLAKASGTYFQMHSQEVKRRVLAVPYRGVPERTAMTNVSNDLIKENTRLRAENERLKRELQELRSQNVDPVPVDRSLGETEPETANTLVADIERQLSLGADRYVGWTLGQAKAALITGGTPRSTVIKYVKKYGPKMRDNLGQRLLAWWGKE